MFATTGPAGTRGEHTRKYEKLKMLVQWPEDIVEKISVDADTVSESLGVTCLNELNGLSARSGSIGA